MATAIVRGHAAAGFVIAADGRSCDLPSYNISSDSTQKIFQVGDCAAYCMTGYSRLGDRRENSLDTVLFDFSDQIALHAGLRSVSSFGSLLEYGQQVAEGVYCALRAACQNPEIDLPTVLSDDGQGQMILNLFVDGYAQGRAERLRIRFWHESGAPGTPEIVSEANDLDVWRYGSEWVAARFRDPSFRAKYDRDIPAYVRHDSPDLTSLARTAFAYIRACSGTEGLENDPDMCRATGGHIHIATITLADGFKWIPGCEPLA